MKRTKEIHTFTNVEHANILYCSSSILLVHCRKITCWSAKVTIWNMNVSFLFPCDFQVSCDLFWRNKSHSSRFPFSTQRTPVALKEETLQENPLLQWFDFIRHILTAIFWEPPKYKNPFLWNYRSFTKECCLLEVHMFHHSLVILNHGMDLSIWQPWQTVFFVNAAAQTPENSTVRQGS